MALEPTIRAYQPRDQQQVVALWQRCGLVVPQNDPVADIARKLDYQPELFLVTTLAGTVVATVMAGYEGHRGWINYLAVAPEHRCRDIGRRLMTATEEKLAAQGCPKINLQVRSGNAGVVEFYERLGYQVDEVISMGKRL